MVDGDPRGVLVAHIVFRFDYGGLENGVVNLVNGLSSGRFRHVVISLTETTSFGGRLREGVPFYALGKRPGKDLGAYLRLFRLLRKLRPLIVHTRNVGTLDCAAVAFLAGVPVRIHGEHGWDVVDPDGKSKKLAFMRRAMSPLVCDFIAVSEDLRQWMTSVIRLPPAKVTKICNGVDTARFHPREPLAADRSPAHARTVTIGTVTRFSAIKDPLNLVEAFILLHRDQAPGEAQLRLMMVGDGELRERALARLEQAGVADAAWLPGSRDDVPDLLRTIDIFALGSLREGISNTLLEAMASGLPIVATATGGNRELIVSGENGTLVPTADARALAAAIRAYVADPLLRAAHGERARARAVAEFSVSAMIERYCAVYARAADDVRQSSI